MRTRPSLALPLKHRGIGWAIFCAAVAFVLTAGALRSVEWTDLTAWPPFFATRHSPVKPFKTSYQVPDGEIQVEYVDEKNFRLAYNGNSETLVSAGRIYVVLKRAGFADTVLLVSDEAQRKADEALPVPSIGPVDAVTLLAIHTGTSARAAESLYTAKLQRPGALRSTDVIVSRDQQLAHAQLVMRETLLQMDMRLCSNAVQYLLAWWVPELTRNGYAVISTATGLQQKNRPVQLPLNSSIAPPAGPVVQDYRIPGAKS
jgi:hypothetical protein